MAYFCLLVGTHSNIVVDKLPLHPLTGRKKFFSPSLCVIGNGQKYFTFFLQNRLNLNYTFVARGIKINIPNVLNLSNYSQAKTKLKRSNQKFMLKFDWKSLGTFEGHYIFN